MTKINALALYEANTVNSMLWVFDGFPLELIAEWLNIMVRYKSKKSNQKVVEDNIVDIEFKLREDNEEIMDVYLLNKSEKGKITPVYFEYLDKNILWSIQHEDHLIDFLYKIHRAAERAYAVYFTM